MESRMYEKRKRLKQRQRKRMLRRRIKRIIRITLLLLIILIICLIGSCARNNWKEKVATSASVLSGGDVIMHGPFLKSNHYMLPEGGYDYNSIFTYVKDIYNSADYSVLNFESTITNNSNEYMSYPMFRSPEPIVTALSENGIDMGLLANNHIYDNFSNGMTMTMDAMDNNSVEFTGTVRDASDKKYQIKNINDIKVGFINYMAETAKNEAGQRTINAIPVQNNDIDLINSFHYDELDAFYSELESILDEMKEKGVEYVITYLHWGNEYELTQNTQQTEIAQKLCDMGINALIGGHPHVIQPVDVLTSTTGDHQMICAYSVGNHLANQHKGRILQSPDGHTEDGLMVKISLEKTNGGDLILSAVDFIPTWTYRTVGVNDDQHPEFYIFPLKDPEKVIKSAKENSNLDIESDVNDSLNRTDEIVGNGISKVKDSLPMIIHSNSKKSTD